MPDNDQPRFESALNRLEQIIEALERGEPELSAALAKYEEGVRLLGHCHGLLENATRSVALLSGIDEQGEPIVDPFDAQATIERTSTTGSASTAAHPGQPDQPPLPAAGKGRRSKAAPPASVPDTKSIEGHSIEPPF